MKENRRGVCQHRDSNVSALTKLKKYRSYMTYRTYNLSLSVGLEFFQTLHPNPAAAKLNYSAAFEIVENRGGSLARRADQTRDVVMC